MKKIMSLLILISLLVLPALAGRMDAAPAFLPVSAAEAETEIGETVSVEDARHIRITNIVIYDNYWDECDELYIGYYLCGDIYAPGSEGIRIWADGELIQQEDRDVCDLYTSFSEAGEHAVSASGKYNGQWSDPREIWRGEVKTKGDQQATTFTVQMPESAEDNALVVFDWKESELGDTRLYLTCVDGDMESALWNDYYDEDGLYAGRDNILIPGECLSVPAEYVLKLYCEKAGYNSYTYTQHITVPGTAPGLTSVVINNREPVVFTAESSSGRAYQIPVRLSKSDAAKFEWYDTYYGDRTEAEEIAAVDGLADITFSTRCYGGENTREIAVRAWIGDEEDGVWTNWTYAEFNVQVNVTESGAALPPAYTISGGENGAVIISVTGIASGDTIDGYVRGEDGMNRRSVYEKVTSGNSLDITLTTDQLDMSGTYYVSLRTISRGKPYSAYTVRKFVYGSENNIPGPVISVLPEPADGQYSINTEYRLRFEREDAVSFEYKWDTESSKNSVKVENGILLWGEEEDIVYRTRPAQATIMCRAKLADGSWTDWAEKTLTFVSKGALPQPGVSLGGETQPGAGYDLDIILTGCDTDPANVGSYYVQLVKTDTWDEIAWLQLRPGDFTEWNTFTWHIPGSRLIPGSYRVELEAYAQNGFSNAEKETLEFVIPEPAEPMAEGPELVISPDENAYYPGEVTLTAYAEGAVQYRFRVKEYVETVHDVAPDDKGAGVLVPDLQEGYSYHFYVSYRKSANGPWSAETHVNINVSWVSDRFPSQDLRIEAKDYNSVPAGSDLVFTFTPVTDTDTYEYTYYLSHYDLVVSRAMQGGETEQVTALTVWPNNLEENGITVNEDGDYQYTCPARYLLVPGEYCAWIRAIDRWDYRNSARSYVRFTVTDEALSDAPVISVAPGDHYINEWITVGLSMPSAVSVDRYYLSYGGSEENLYPDNSTTNLRFSSPGTYAIHAAAKRADGSWTKSSTVLLAVSEKGTASPVGLTIPEEHPQWKELTATLSGPLPAGGRLEIELEYYDEDDENWNWEASTYVESVSEDNTAFLFGGETFDKPGQYRLNVVTSIPGYKTSEEQAYEFTVTEVQRPEPPVITVVSETVWYDEPFTFTLAAAGADEFNYRLAYADCWYGDSNADADENGTARIEMSASPYDEFVPFELEARARINGIWSEWGSVSVVPQGIILDPVAVAGIKDVRIGEALTLEIMPPENAAGYRWWLYRTAENTGEDDVCVINGECEAETVQLTLDEGRFDTAGIYYLATEAYGEENGHYKGTHTKHRTFAVTGVRLPGPQITLEGLAEGQEEILINQQVTFRAYLAEATDYELRLNKSTYTEPMTLAEDGSGEYTVTFRYGDFSRINCRAKVNGVWTEWSSLSFTVAEGIQLPVPGFSGLKKEWRIGENLVIPVTVQGVKQLWIYLYKCNEYGGEVEYIDQFRSTDGTLTVPEGQFEAEGYYCISGYYFGAAGYLDSEEWSGYCVLHFTGGRYTAPVISLPDDGIWISDYNVFTFESPADEYTADSYEYLLLNSAGEPYEFGSVEESWTWYPNNTGTFTLKVRAKVGSHWSDWSEKTVTVQTHGAPPITFSGKPVTALFPGQAISLTFTDSVAGEIYMAEVYPEGVTTGTSLVSNYCEGNGVLTLDTSDLAAGDYDVRISSTAPGYEYGSAGFTFTIDPNTLTGPEISIEAKDKYLIREPFTVTLQHEDEVAEYWLEARWYDEETHSGGSYSGSSTETFGVYTLTLPKTGTWTVRAQAKIGEDWTQWSQKTVLVTSLGEAEFPAVSYETPVLRGGDIVATVTPKASTDCIWVALISGGTQIAEYCADSGEAETVTFGREYYDLAEGEYLLRVRVSPAAGYENNPAGKIDYPVTLNCFTLDRHEYQAATCTADGNIEYWYCTTCGKYYADEDATLGITEESTVIPAIGHIDPLDHTEAKAATCTEAGNIEYWHCTRCGGYFADADAKTEIAPADIVIPALGHMDPMVHTAAKPATCTEKGNIEYWYCSRCSRFFRDAAAENEIAPAEIVIPAEGHDNPMEHTAEKEATCTESGNIEYWHCTKCGKYFTDAGGKTEISLADTVVPARGHIDPLIHVEAKPAGCTEEGNIEYWYCSRCDGYFADAGAETETNRADVIIGAKGHKYPLTHTAAKPATCTEAGNVEYWHCSDCGRNFSDENGENEISGSVIIPKKSHDMEVHDALAATCTTAGNSAYWYCRECRKYYSNAQGTAEIEEGSWRINALGHKMIHHPAVTEATCTEAESSEYWSCERCRKYFADEAGTEEIAENSWVINAAPGHDWGEPEYKWSADNKKCTAKRTCTRDSSHVETEEGTVTSRTTPATVSAAGKTVYTATFTNTAFTEQTKTVTLPKLEPAKPPVGSYTDKATGTYDIKADGTATFVKPVTKKSKVTIPNTIKVKGFSVPVTAIADKAFSKDNKLTTITIGNNVKTIGKNAFSGCAKLKTVKGGGKVEIIRDNAFSDCVKLSKLPAFPKLKTIGANAFKGCKALTKVTIGASVNSIGKNAFNGCAKLKTITIKSTLLTKKNVKSGAFKGIAAKATVKCPKAKLEDYRKFLPGKGVPKTAKIK